MRILYVSSESPLFPAGGIGTYVDIAATAMAAAGHEVFLFTWRYTNISSKLWSYGPFSKETSFVYAINGETVFSRYPTGPYHQALSHILSDEIARLVQYWSIDVVESIDFQCPALAYFARVRATGDKVVTSTFNHGLIQQSYEASRLLINRAEVIDLVGERQQCRVSDVVIAPSAKAVETLISMGVTGNVEVIREPFSFSEIKRNNDITGDLVHLGRVTIAKGVDRVATFARTLDQIAPVSGISFVGNEVETPYKSANIRDYIRARLGPSLAEKTVFLGPMPRDIALKQLRPGNIMPSFSLSETFSYTFVEAVDNDLLPFAGAGTAVAEFYPESLSELLLNLASDTWPLLQRKIERTLSDANAIRTELLEYNVKSLDPSIFAERVERVYESAALRKLSGRSSISMSGTQPKVALRYGPSDITVLMPIYEPDEVFSETVDSLAAQTSQEFRVILCDDGSSDQSRWRLDYALMRLNKCEIVHQPNGGLLAARNTLISLCETPLALFLDGDDILSPDYLERALFTLNNNEGASASMLYRRNFLESDEKIIRFLIGDYVHLLINDDRMTALIKSDVLREIGFDATNRNGEGDDWAFWVEFHARGHKAVLLPEEGFHYRFRSGSMSWPWSQGQRVGTALMIREAIRKLALIHPNGIEAVANAFLSSQIIVDH